MIARRKPIERRSRPRRARKSSLAAKKRTLWSYFAAYVKARDGSRCFTCDRHADGVYLHAGHLFSRSRGATLYDPLNCHSQCASCNRGLRGNVPAYIDRFIATYGADKLEALAKRAAQDRQWKEFQVEALIAALKRGGADFEMLYEDMNR